MNKNTWLGQEVLFKTYFPRNFGVGKEYYMMKDGDGTHYLAKIGEDGNPNLT